ncbi:MAG: 50S ribosomal protein L31 [Candidatus Levybacteria bacterium RBG_16_35_11]|nr:MAG: 50S ribosomal protein L31 [Candidatus Levybacteria bacterium RBG_16_35_11]
MKQAIHPSYNDKAQVVCVCGNRFNVGSTRDEIHVELCSKCHPFYTGEQRFVDTANRIDRFEKKRKVATEHQQVVKAKKEEKKKVSDAPKTLREMLNSMR